MSSGQLNLKDTESQESNLDSSSSSNTGSKDAPQVSDSDCIHQNLNQESKEKSKEKAINKPSTESLDDQEEDKNLATPMQDTSVGSIIPAIKGSREKHGKSPEKLSVSWTDDVYDPVPSSVSHTVTNKPKKPQTSSKGKYKNRKKGQKGSSSGGKNNKYS